MDPKTPIAEIEFSPSRPMRTRIRNVLAQNDIHTLEDLLRCSWRDLIIMRSLGMASVVAIMRKLNEEGLELAPPTW